MGQIVETLPDTPAKPVARGSIATLILGESGSGKSTSLRNCDPQKTLLIQPIRKPLPFRSANWQTMQADGTGSVVVTDDANRICQLIGHAHEIGKTMVVVDDYQYVMCNEFMVRAREKGYEKYTEIGQNAWRVIRSASDAAEGVNVYLLSHVALNDGVLKAKTIGRMVDEKVVVEGMFSIVLRSLIQDGHHYFSTRNSGMDTVKSPIGMFDEELIDNDLAAVDAAIRDYYAR